METQELPETSKSPSLLSISLTQGAILGVALIIYSLILNFLGLNEQSWWNLILNTVIVALVLNLAMKEFKRDNQGYLSMGQGISLGSLVSLFGAILSAGFSVIYIYLIDPEFIERTLRRAEIQLVSQNPDMSDQQIDYVLSFSEWFLKPVPVFMMGLIVTFILGFLISIVMAFVNKKEPIHPF